MSKQQCNISKADFLSSAEGLLIVFNEIPIELHPKEFSTGSFGWNGSSRSQIDVNDIPLVVQISTNATVLKSKEAPETTILPQKAATRTEKSVTPLNLTITTKELSELLPVNEVLFFPDTNNKNLERMFTFLKAAQHTVDVCVFVFTDKRLFDVLQEVYQRGVQIRIIVDDQMSKISSSKAYGMLELGVDVRMDSSPFHMHHKFAIVDNQVILTGSFNWTVQAQRSNRENLHITSDTTTIGAYTAEFERLWSEYTNRPKPPKN